MGKKETISIMPVVPLIGLWLTSSSSLAGPPDNYTAKMVMEGMTMPMVKIGNKTRVENPMMQGLVNISLMDPQKMIMISTANKSYMEQPMEREGTPSPDDPRVVKEKKKTGTETIDGHPCNKYDAVFYMKDNPSEKYKAALWEAKDLGGMIIRNETTPPPRKRAEEKVKS